MKTYVVMLAGGRGERMNAPVNKVLLRIGGIPVVIRSMEAFSAYADEMVIVTRPVDREEIMSEASSRGFPCPFRFADGGETRQASVLNGLRALCPDPDGIVLIHDAARCLVDPELISRVILSVKENGSGIPGIPATNTCKICGPDGYVLQTPERSSLFEIQTPQGFSAGLILDAEERAAAEGFLGTDDACVLEHYGYAVKVVPGSSANIKLTEPGDMARARMLLEGDGMDMRIGMGYDVHRLTPHRKLILCGVEIPFELGLHGHSDADVALHALMDAMLGACALGDIGSHFPDTEERYRGISSAMLLRETVRILADAGFRVHNADLTIVAQKPKILPYIPLMTANIAAELGIPQSSVSVKATTTEKLGFEGRMEGISAYAVCTVTES